MTATRFSTLIETLNVAGVEFVLVGGAAAIAHGTARVTQDLDVVYHRSAENLKRLVSALAPFAPYPRGAPPGLPFAWDFRALQLGCNFTLSTTLGLIDLLGEITGGGSYQDLLPHTFEVHAFNSICRCLDLETLIRVKQAAGRPKDFEAIAELEALRIEREKRSD